MSNTTSSNSSLAVATLRSPLLWGGLGALGFYALIHRGLLTGDFVQRYFASHPVEYIAVTMFFVGLAALAIKMLEVTGQFAGLDEVTLGTSPDGGHLPEEAGGLANLLDEAPITQQNGYLVSRLRAALEYVRRKNSADELDAQLHHLSEADADRMHSGYALVRIIIWAIPILGFLGTVIGITLAIAKLGPQDLENSLPAVIDGLRVAFDTTALALALSMILMFAQFMVDRLEGRLLASVDDRVEAEMVGRFRQYGSATDPQVAAVRRMAESVVQATERLVGRQADIWQASMEEAQRHWIQTTASAGKQLEESFRYALASGMKEHAEMLSAIEREAAEANRQHWSRVQAALVDASAAAANQQAELAKQSDILLKVVDATGQVRALEQALNDNLATLAGARNFDETVTSLSAAIQLLSSRLGETTSGRKKIELQTRANNAA